MKTHYYCFRALRYIWKINFNEKIMKSVVVVICLVIVICTVLVFAVPKEQDDSFVFPDEYSRIMTQKTKYLESRSTKNKPVIDNNRNNSARFFQVRLNCIIFHPTLHIPKKKKNIADFFSTLLLKSRFLRKQFGKLSIVYLYFEFGFNILCVNIESCS